MLLQSIQKYYDFFFYKNKINIYRLLINIVNNKNKINIIIHVSCYLQFIQKLLMHVNKKKIYEILIIFFIIIM